MSGFRNLKLKKRKSTSRVFAGKSFGRVSRTVGTTGRRRRSSGVSGKPRRRLFDGVDQTVLARVLTVVAFLAVVGIGVWIIIASANSGGSEIAMSLGTADISRPITPEDGETEGSSKMTIALGGSVKLHGEVLDAAGAANYDFNNYLYEMSPVMSADLSVVNLLGSISTDQYSAYPSGLYPQQLAEALGSININAAVTANSQTMLYGLDSLAVTTQALENNDIDCLGTSVSGGQKWKVVDYNGILVGIGAYNCSTAAEIKALADKQKAAGATQEQIDACVNQLSIDITSTEGGKGYSDASRAILADVDSMRENGAEIVIVLINWGSADQTAPSDAMTTLAQRMIDAKVDITVGFGPDTVEKITVREVANDDGTTKNCYVFYSLGNFFADCDKGATAKKYESMVVRFDVVKSSEDTAASISSGAIYPIHINRDSTYMTENTQHKYQVIPAGLYEYKASGITRPAAFTSDALWEKYTSTFTHIRTYVQSTWDVDKYFSLGSVTGSQSTQESNGGSSESTNL